MNLKPTQSSQFKTILAKKAPRQIDPFRIRYEKNLAIVKKNKRAERASAQDFRTEKHAKEIAHEKKDLQEQSFKIAHENKMRLATNLRWRQLNIV